MGICSKLYTWKHVITSLSSAVGPIVSVVLFIILGNQWKVINLPTHLSRSMWEICSPIIPAPEGFGYRESGGIFLSNHLSVLQADDCRIVLLFGLTFMVLPLSIMCFFNDDRTLGDISDAAR